MHVCRLVWVHTYINESVDICACMYKCIMSVSMCVFMFGSHRGGLQQYYYDVHALGIIHHQQSWFGAIC